MEDEKRVYAPYVPKLRYGDEIDFRVRKRIAGVCFKNEERLIEAIGYAYRSKVARKRRVIRPNTLLYQVKLENDMTVEVAYLEVGIKGVYVRYSKVKKLRWRDKKRGRRFD